MNKLCKCETPLPYVLHYGAIPKMKVGDCEKCNKPIPKELNGLLIMFNLTDEDKSILVGYTLFIDNGDYIVIPEELYDEIPESIGDKYGIHHIHIKNEFGIQK